MQPDPAAGLSCRGGRHTSSTLSKADERVSSELIASSAMAQRGPHIGTLASHRGSSLLCRPAALCDPLQGAATCDFLHSERLQNKHSLFAWQSQAAPAPDALAYGVPV